MEEARTMTSLKLDLKSKRLIERFAGQRTQRQLLSATKKAGASALRKMKAETSRVVRAEKNLKVSDVKPLIKGVTTEASTADKMGWRITVDGAAIPIGSFPMRQLKGGVKFKANKASWSKYKGGFIAVMKSGHRGAFTRRKGETSRREKYRNTQGKKNKSQLPIKELHTSGLSSAFKSQSNVNKVLDVGSSEFEITFLRVIKAKL